MISSARFECTKCGECCYFDRDSIVFVTEEELRAMTAALGWRPATQAVEDGRLSLVPESGRPAGFCEVFDPATKTCRAYEARPAQCRSFPFWPSNVASELDWLLTSIRCEGVGRGELITEDQLLARLREAPRGL